MKTLNLEFKDSKLVAMTDNLKVIIYFKYKLWQFEISKSTKVVYRGHNKNLLPVLNKVIEIGLRLENFSTTYDNKDIINMINHHKEVDECF